LATENVKERMLEEAHRLEAVIEGRDFWQRHCNELDYEMVNGLLKDLLLQKRSVGVKQSQLCFVWLYIITHYFYILVL
jgi:hypothetical protein